MEAMDQLLELFDLAPELNFGTNQGWAPGKLFLAGEYAVLAPDQPALLFAVGQYLHCQVGISPWPGRGLLQSNLPGLEDWHYERANLYVADSAQWRYVLAAMQIVEDLVEEVGRPLQDYRLSIDSQLLADNGRKYGFGSSGAVTVAVIQALLAFYGLVAKSPLMHYKLAAMAMMRLGSKGSLADLAVNAYGGWLYYVAPDRVWLQETLANHSILSLLSQDWPNLVIQPMFAPADLEVLVGWTGVPASTDNLIDQWQDRSGTAYQAFLSSAKETVQAIKEAFETGDSLAIQSRLADYRHLLLQIEKHNTLSIETPALRELVTIAQAYQFEAKSSGAGGGDCGIAVGQGQGLKKELAAAWQTAGITLVELEIGAPQRPSEEAGN